VIKASGWRALAKGSLQGFVDLELQPSGLLIHSCTLMESNGKRWIGLPGRPQVQKDGTPILDPKIGKPLWKAIIEIKNREARERFQLAALRAVDVLLGKGAP
jgi:hypothetical protein